MRHRAALVEKSRLAIADGSKSFSAASRLFDKTTRERVWMLYAWCRRCDDLADAQDMGGALGDQSDIGEAVKHIRLLTQAALDGQPTADPAFDAFGQVASEVGLTMEDADAVIAGFELDADDWRPRSEADLMRYCWHVAGAVGVMMALVMGVKREDAFTLDRAADLGFAFQLANIARDVVEDDAVGRCYLPAIWLVEEDIEPGQHTKPHHRQELADMAARLIALMEHHAAASRIGAAKLPFRSRWAILSAARIYTAIGREVEAKGTAAWDHRVYTSKAQKIGHVTAAFFEALRNRPPSLEAMPKWTRTELAEMGRAS
ncbi:phytoene/squalene synthase family protein [Altererythrobacter sp. JGD-16]|uniref:Phytoene/squalene synthase family protein n=2 Tax=Altererythrobacter lutimaris TaxID=2743979 RepID=A0A850HFQ5_9SPHN|nr:phytoene/squalene synthase family protein [Altererythrobacter lutimaris]